MQSKAQNAVNPNGLTSILTQQCEKFALKKRVRIILVCLREALKTESCITVSGQSSAEYTEKRSRFIAVIRHCETEQEAVSFINDIRAKHRDARHNCYAYSVSGGAVKRFSDDGEPHGTAGKPMLDIIDGEGLCNVCAVVTRYFGGVLLGTGGLLRAYTAAAADALADAGISVVRRWLACEVSMPYALYEPVRAAVAALGGVVQETQYAAAVTLCALLPEEAGEAFAAQVRDLTAGRCAVRPVGETERAVPLADAGL